MTATTVAPRMTADQELALLRAGLGLPIVHRTWCDVSAHVLAVIEVGSDGATCSGSAHGTDGEARGYLVGASDGSDVKVHLADLPAVDGGYDDIDLTLDEAITLHGDLMRAVDGGAVTRTSASGRVVTIDSAVAALLGALIAEARD